MIHETKPGGPITVELLRVEFRIYAIERNEDGNISGERVIGDGVAYPPGLPLIPDEINKVILQANEAHK